MKRGITPRSKMHRSLPPEMIVAAFSLVARPFDRRDRNGQIIERIIAYAKRSRWESLASANINATHAAIAVSHFGHCYHRPRVSIVSSALPLRAFNRSTMKNGL